MPFPPMNVGITYAIADTPLQVSGMRSSLSYDALQHVARDARKRASFSLVIEYNLATTGGVVRRWEL
jgi:hypothetical protein